jgi:hypothetical protein
VRSRCRHRFTAVVLGLMISLPLEYRRTLKPRNLGWAGRGGEIQMATSAGSASGAIKRAESTRNGWSAPKNLHRRTVVEDRVTELEASKADGSYADHKAKITVAECARDCVCDPSAPPQSG